jgi:hypothetical protein
MTIRLGIIKAFRGSWGSGIGFLDIEDSRTKQLEAVPCDNGATVRALEAAFGDVISPGHTANGQGHIGRKIYWSLDDLGLVLAGFTPADDASEEVVQAYKNQ